MKINSKIVTGTYTIALSLAFSAPRLAADLEHDVSDAFLMQYELR